MHEDMPKPSAWVSISVKGDEHYVHIRRQGVKETLGPFASHHDAAVRAKQEWQRVRAPEAA